MSETVLTRGPVYPDDPDPRDLRRLGGYELYRALRWDANPARVRVESVCDLPDGYICDLFAMRAFLPGDGDYPSGWCNYPDSEPRDEATIAGLIREGMRNE